MGRVNDTISNVNSALRNLLLLILIGGAGIGGYKAYDMYWKPQLELKDKQAAIDDLNVRLKEKTAEVDRLQVAMKLLGVQHRLARLTVLEQREVPPTVPSTSTAETEASAARPNVETKIEFVDISEQGDAIGSPKTFEIKGDMIYIDYLTVNFEDKYIAKSDLDRDTSIALFQRIFGEHQEPAKGFQLDTVGTRPTAYARGTKISDFEKKIWDDFWLIANDSKRAHELGIDAIQGKAVAIRAQPGKSYEIKLRSTGDITIRPIDSKSPYAAGTESGS